MTDAILISVIAGVAAVFAATVSAYFSYRAVAISRETHLIVNSRMEEFLRLARLASRAEGVLEEKERTKNL